MKRKRQITQNYISPAIYKRVLEDTLPQYTVYALKALQLKFGFGHKRMMEFLEMFNQLNSFAESGILGKRKFDNDDIKKELIEKYQIPEKSFTVESITIEERKK